MVVLGLFLGLFDGGGQVGQPRLHLLPRHTGHTNHKSQVTTHLMPRHTGLTYTHITRQRLHVTGALLLIGVCCLCTLFLCAMHFLGPHGHMSMNYVTYMVSQMPL